ncbi:MULTISPECIES: hypothetical protein [Thalassospira]|uniref:PAS domain-containing protein n=2 Tax=Thalassospira TaxID=168934 RepID=A0A367W084_9PROT|nr:MULTISPECIES: hypothetical protein [Thalassospira]MDG4717875.1 hypothetical protein [Thalassospira sp. FZY0004]RCK32387.1 hypothetical protein TH19_19045 [Thalassospira profundimaris]
MLLGHPGLALGAVVAIVAAALAFLMPNWIYDNPVLSLIVILMIWVLAYISGRFSNRKSEPTTEALAVNPLDNTYSPSVIGEYIHTVTAPCLLINGARRVVDANTALENLWGISITRLIDGHIAFSENSVLDDLWSQSVQEVPIGISMYGTGDILLRGEVKSTGTFHFT